MRRNAIATVAALLLAACASGAGPGDVERGKQLFNAPVASPRGEQPPCSRCHAVDKDKPSPSGLGTNFYDIGKRAGGIVEGQSAEQYLHTGIVDPDAFLAGGFQDGLMYREYGKALTQQQIADLVAYMLVLRGGP